MDLPLLEDVLQYKNEAVLKLYRQNYPDNELSAEDAFTETLKYLWLTQHHKKHYTKDSDLPPNCIMLRSMQEIDEMWHEFILFTKDYMDFCERYFGCYIHHLPNVFDNAPISAAEADAEVKQLLPYIYDQLGSDTMQVWFKTYLS